LINAAFSGPRQALFRLSFLKASRTFSAVQSWSRLGSGGEVEGEGAVGVVGVAAGDKLAGVKGWFGGKEVATAGSAAGREVVGLNIRFCCTCTWWRSQATALMGLAAALGFHLLKKALASER
jgi:hypothetical protein